MFLKIMVIVFLGVSLVSCSRDPMNKTITKENFKEVIEEVGQKSSEEDKQKVKGVLLLAGFASMRGGKPEDIFIGKSFNEVIKEVQVNIEKDRIKREMASPKRRRNR